jgi:uncharacterized protein
MTLSAFIGRDQELQVLQEHFNAVKKTGVGRLLTVRGRRQCGKSRLISEFCAKAASPYIFYTAIRGQSENQQLHSFAEEISRSNLGAGSQGPFSQWESALRQLALLLPRNKPSIVVFDEFPWLQEASPSADAVMQVLWDRVFESIPVFAILVGSDLAMMQKLTAYDNPLYGRAKETVISPLNLGDVASMLKDNKAADKIETYLAIGGFPRLALEMRQHPDLWSFIRAQLRDENSDLALVGQRILSSEFSSTVQAERILMAIGSGARTHKQIGQTAEIAAAPLSRSLHTLVADKGLVTAATPLSSKPSRETRYWVADPYLRFWLRFIRPTLPEVARGRGDLALERIRAGWPTFVGQAVEPLVRQSLERLAMSDPALQNATQIGGYWTRTNTPEVDLIGVGAKHNVVFVGSIKWRRNHGFDSKDLQALALQRAQVPGAEDAALIGVIPEMDKKRSGLDATFDARALIGAWQRY